MLSEMDAMLDDADELYDSLYIYHHCVVPLCRNSPLILSTSGN